MPHLAPHDAVLEIGRRQKRRGRADHRTELDRSERDFPERRDIGQHDQQAVAAPHAQVPQEVRHPARTLAHLRKREPGLAAVLVGHPQGQPGVITRQHVEIVDGPVETLELGPVESGIRRRIVLAVREEEITGFEKRLSRGHGIGGSAHRFRPGLKVRGRDCAIRGGQRKICMSKAPRGKPRGVETK